MSSIIIPIKQLLVAKRRLMGALDAQSRANLVLAMLKDVLANAANADCGRLLIVAGDDAVFDIARPYGAQVIRESEVCGYNAAVSLGFAAAGDGNVSVLPGDVPLATSDEIACLCAPADVGSRCVRLAASHDRLGTNGLFLASRDLIAPGFGFNSFVKYQKSARAAGIETTLIETPGLARDIDTPADLRELARLVSGGATMAFLDGVKDRIADDDLGRGAA